MNTVTKIGLMMQGGMEWLGGAEYIKNIIFALSSLPEDEKKTIEVFLFYNKVSENGIKNQLISHVKAAYSLDVELELPTVLNKVKWKIRKIILKQENPRFSDLFIRKNIDFIYPYFIAEEERYTFKSCSWIADFQHKYFPQFFSKVEIEIRDREFAQIANSKSRVVLSSNSAKQDFRKFFPNSECKLEVLNFRTILPNNWNNQDKESTPNKYNLPSRFFLISNQFWQHKNHLAVFEALKILQKKYIFPEIVCTGHIYDRRKPEYIDIILQKISTYNLSSQVYLLGLIPKVDQIELMRCSLAVIQPSLFEGWSTVIEEARCLGKKIILSDIPVHIEQNPPNGIFFERNSAQELSDSIAQCWKEMDSGIDAEEEKAAQIRSENDINEFGYRFLEIARGIGR